MTVAHVWPGITPLNVWDMEWAMWNVFARAADDYRDQMREGNRG